MEPTVLIKRVYSQLENYQSQETKTITYRDYTLVGLISLAKAILVANPGILSKSECDAFLNMLVQKCLFNQSQEPFGGHITEDVDLQSLSQKSVNKCHSTQARNAAYKLLETVIATNSDPQLVQRLVQDFWVPFVLQLRMPKDAGFSYSPLEHNRSPFGFAGLRNPGCICYMNSMIQQLFNVPAFRYSLLAADDRKPLNIVEDKNGKKIDDNLLHQMVRMFSFL